MSCLRSSIVMVSVLATSRGLCGHYSWRWVIASPHFLTASRGCFMETHTIGVCVWSSMRGLWPIIFTASATWLMLSHWGGRSREAWERLHEKLWHCCGMKRRNKWSNCSTTTSRAGPEKDVKLWWCPWEIATTLGASRTKWSWLMLWSEILMRPSRRLSC
jgi:hypothetical protein